MLLSTYNLAFFILIILVIGFLTYTIARMVHSFSRWIESFILLFGFFIIGCLLHYFGNVNIKNLEKQVVQKLNNPVYSIKIMPKMHPYSEDLVLDICNKENTVKIHMRIKSELNADEIAYKLKDKQEFLNQLLK